MFSSRSVWGRVDELTKDDGTSPPWYFSYIPPCIPGEINDQERDQKTKNERRKKRDGLFFM